MRKFGILLFTVLATSLVSCDYQKTNRIEQKDIREGDEWVYGINPDSVARQLKNKYTPNPELEKRTQAIQEKMFGLGKSNEGV
jgi:phosphomevalonate kinase